jgi:hypothetical protein
MKMFDKLVRILTDKYYPNSRNFIFPRQSGTTTLLHNIARHISLFYGKVLFVNNYTNGHRPFTNPPKDLYDEICVSNITEALRGSSYKYIIFDNSFYNAKDKELWLPLFPNYISIDTK